VCVILSLFTDYHSLDNIRLPKIKNYPPSLPEVAWNPWNDLRKRHDIQTLNLTYPFEPLPGTQWSFTSSVLTNEFSEISPHLMWFYFTRRSVRLSSLRFT
jgi:hypothetical protein